MDMADILRQRLRHCPFQPFRITLVDGTRYEIAQQFCVAMGLMQFTIVFPRTDRFIFVGMNQVTSIESIERAA